MPDSSSIFDNSTSAYAMVNIETKNCQLLRQARRKVKFDTPEIIQDVHVPTKVSIVPRPGNQESQRLTKASYKQKGIFFFSEVNDSDSNFAEDANSFFCEGKTKSKPSALKQGASTVKVGTDCSGTRIPGIPIIASENIGICYRHLFDSDSDKEVQKTIRANHEPEILYDNIQGRDVNLVPYTDLYMAGFPCQPFSTMGKQEGFDDTQGRGTIFFDILDYIQTKVSEVFVSENVTGLVKINKGKERVSKECQSS